MLWYPTTLQDFYFTQRTSDSPHLRESSNHNIPPRVLVNKRHAKLLEVCTPDDGHRQLISAHCSFFIFRDMLSLHRRLHHYWCNR
jgi:hypothetical protein